MGEFFKTSIFVEPNVADRKVTGYLREGTLETALDTLSFFTRSTWRKTGGAIYIGDEEKERYYAIPSAGLDAAAIKVIWPQSVLSGDTILLKSKPTEFSQLKTLIEGMQRRNLSTVRILIADVGGDYRDPVNSFVETMAIGTNFTGDLLKKVTITAPVTINAVYDFLKKNTDVQIKTYTDYRVVSGEEIKLTAGNVLERQVFVRPTEATDGSANTLVTRFDRLQLGLTVSLHSFYYDDRWFVRYDVQDADFQSDTERRTATTGSIELSTHSLVKLFSLDRKRSTTETKDVKGLSSIPFLGRAFRSKGSSSDSRVLYVFIQWMSDDQVTPGQVSP